MFPDVAKLRIRIKELRFDGHPPRLPHVQVRLGHRVFTSPKRAVEAPWNDVYDFDLSFHEHLFYTLQVLLYARLWLRGDSSGSLTRVHYQLDVYDTRTLLPRAHRGRAEIRLLRLTAERKATARYGSQIACPCKGDGRLTRLPGRS